MKRSGGETVALSHPVVVVGLVVWLLNDHVLKAAYGTWWTGKLSDVAGLVVFPLLLATVLGRWVPRAIEWSAGLTALLFAAINVWGPADWLVEAGLSLVVSSTLTPDVTDLFVLPVVGVSWWVWYQPPIEVGRFRLVVGRLVFGIGLLATLATSSDGVSSERYEGTVILTEAKPEVVIPLHLTLDGEPYAPSDAMRLSVQMTAFGGGPEGQDGPQAPEAAVVEVVDGAGLGDGSVVLRLREPSFAPVQVGYEMYAWYDDSSGEAKIELQAELPADESIEPILSWEGIQHYDEGLYQEWRITALADSTLVFGMSSAVDPNHIRLVGEGGRIDHPGGRTVPIDPPAGCTNPCEFSIWLAGTPQTGSGIDVALYDLTGRATVEVIDLERYIHIIELDTEKIRVNTSGSESWTVDLTLPDAPETPREQAMTFLTYQAAGDRGTEGGLSARATLTGLGGVRPGQVDGCCQDVQLSLEITDHDLQGESREVSAFLQLRYQSPTPFPIEQFSATLRRN